MAQKKKRKPQRKACNKTAVNVKQEIAEEILALSSIFAEEFVLHADGIGFGLSVVPHPGSLNENYTSLSLDIRYTAGYPNTALQLRLSNVTGLSADDTKLLWQQLHDAAAAFAQESCVCVFNLVGLCQEFLLDRNDAAKQAVHALRDKPQLDSIAPVEDAAAHAAGKGFGDPKIEAQSLWHEMQQRMLQQAAQGEAEISSGLGASIPSNILGEDLWMFTTGLFYDDGESAFTVPNLGSPAIPASNRATRSSGRTAPAADKSPEPLSRRKDSGQLLDSPPASSTSTPSHMHQVAVVEGGKNLAHVGVQEQGRVDGLEAPAGDGMLLEKFELANITQASGQHGLPGSTGDIKQHTLNSREHSEQRLQLGRTEDSNKHMQHPLLPHNLNCSFSNLPKGLQQLLGNSARNTKSKHSSARHRHGKTAQEHVQGSAVLAHPTPAAGPPVFGDFDSSIFKRFASSDNVVTGRDSSSWSESTHAQQGCVAAPVGSADGEIFQSCISDTGASNPSDDESDEESSSQAKAADVEGSDSEGEEGVSLKSQLLTGYLLLLAVVANGGSGDAAFIAQAHDVAGGLSTGGSSEAQCFAGTRMVAPASLLPLADHLRQAGLLSKWVHWLLQQYPQRPELFQRAFKRLFQQEIQGCSSCQSGTKPLAGAVAQHFWNSQVQAAATVASQSAVPVIGTSSSAALQAVASAPAAGSVAQAATASVLSAADAAKPASQVAVNSRYRSDFQELQPLGRGGFGLVVSAINRLDGRKYAVKKIKLQPSGGSSYARILREVATLSRLQHPNIVRYFQAWTEEAAAEGDADFWGESDEGEWGDLGLSEESEEDKRDSTQYNTSTEESSCRKTEAVQEALATGAAVDSNASTQWASGTSGASCNSSPDDSVETSSRSSSHGKGAVDELEFSIPPHLPPTVSPLKQRPAPAQKIRALTKESKPSGRRQRTRIAGTGQILYIQMEFCPRTLAQVLEGGGLDEADAWLVLRGILAGLAHIHAQGAIHRDLKPANIFYDSKGEIKLGDFGLAKFNTASAAGGSSDGTGDGVTGKTGSPQLSGVVGQRRHSSVGGVASAVAPSDVTGICGTGLYISPEIANGWASYNEKVDLYSLGVVVFEMWHPFGTAMERLAVLRELRETGRMPPDWEAAHPQVARLVRWLMSPKPADRPSARQVLQSDLLPPRLEDEQLKDLLRSLPDNPVAYERVIDSLFSIGSSKQQEQQKLFSSGHQLPGISVAAGEGAAAGLQGTGLLTSQQDALSLSELPGAPIDSNVELEDVVCKVVKSVCAVHGAVQSSSTSLGLSHAALPRDAVRFLAPSGAQMALRYEVRYPLAVWFAQQAAMASAVPFGLGTPGGWVTAHQQHISAAAALERGLKRLEVCRVNRAGRGGRGLPASYLQADVDIIVPAGAGINLREKMLAEAEVLKVATQVLEALPDLGPYEVRLGHTHLFAAAIAGMCLPPEVTPASVMALLSSAISISAAIPGGQVTAGTAGPAASSGREMQGVNVTDKPHIAQQGHATAGSNSSTGRASMWTAVRAGLDGLGLDAKPVSRCRQCTLKLPGHLNSQVPLMRSFLQELRPQLGSAGLAAAISAVDELEALGQLLVDWGLAPDNILLEPLLTPPSEYFGGVLFQVLLRSASPQSSTVYTSAVAAGGRYDGLLRSLWSPAAASVMPAPGAVGVSINCDKLIKAMLQRGQHKGGCGVLQGAVGGLPGVVGLQGGRLQTGQCDVLVCAKGGDGMLQLRMQLLAQLWSAGVSAALLPRETPSLTEQYEYAHESGARWLIILDNKTTGPSQLVRVKSLERKGEDTSIHIADLGRFLQLGLSGAQDPSRSIATSSGLQGSAPGHWGSVGMPAAGVGSSVGGVGTSQGQSYRVLQRFTSDGRLGSATDSLDADYDTAGVREREVGAARDRELLTGRHRDRRR